ncbi:hypothetical protein J437_LFUL007384 [Ladona fulva]|uniref:Uncharacterized protein n=1 Tax=Ladona fulva TaxID=123851 RepID=A0A8K0K1D9_LADFU|nr:hypothetical protein J437_LFUL007384 [Ladona fulva]
MAERMHIFQHKPPHYVFLLSLIFCLTLEDPKTFFRTFMFFQKQMAEFYQTLHENVFHTPSDLIQYYYLRKQILSKLRFQLHELKQQGQLLNSGPLTDMKFIPASFATALAKRVFPQPGGPHNNTPAAAFKPIASNSRGCLTEACR